MPAAGYGSFAADRIAPRGCRPRNREPNGKRHRLSFATTLYMMDHARPGDRRDHIGRASDRGLIAKDRYEAIDAVDADFCSVITRVWGPSSGQVCSPAVSVIRNTRSTGPTRATSSVTFDIFEMEIAERALSILSA